MLLPKSGDQDGIAVRVPRVYSKARGLGLFDDQRASWFCLSDIVLANAGYSNLLGTIEETPEADV